MTLFKSPMYLEAPSPPTRRQRGVDYADRRGHYRSGYARRERVALRGPDQPAPAACDTCDCSALDRLGLPVCQVAVVGDTRVLRDYAWAA